MTDLMIVISDENDEQLRRFCIQEDGSDSEIAEKIVNQVTRMYPESVKDLNTDSEIHLFPIGGDDREVMAEEAISRAQGLVDGYVDIEIDYVAIGRLAIAGLRSLQGKDGVMEAAAKAIGFTLTEDTPGPGAKFVEHWNPESHWENHPDHDYEEWVLEVKSNSTRLGYVEWVNHQVEAQLTEESNLVAVAQS